MAEEKIVRTTLFGKEARLKLLKGVDAVANPVKATMGAKGRVVVTSTGHITKDGVTVARDIDLKDDPLAAHGAKLIKAAAVKTCDVAGDGTTTVCVLAQAMIHEGVRLLESGKDAQELKGELEALRPVIVKAIEEQAKQTTDVRFIANVSANDPVIGEIVAKAVSAVGADGLVSIENTYDETQVEVVDGMQIDRGVFLPVCFTDFQRRKAEYENAKVIIYKGKIHDQVGLGRVLESLAKASEAVVLIADDYEVPVLRMIELSRIQSGVRLLALKSPNIYHDETLQDLAIYTGATVVLEADGFKSFNASWIGQVKSVVSTPDRTIFRAMDDRAEQITARVGEIYEAAKAFTEAERRNVEKRAARLQGKMAVIKMNVAMDETGREVKDRIEDAIYASQAALEKGIVEGGGLVFIKAASEIEGVTDGARLLKTSLEAPLRQIVKNAGESDSRVLGGVLKCGRGYNVITGAFEDFMESGIVDPVKVSLIAFNSALDVAVLALTTEAITADEKIYA